MTRVTSGRSRVRESRLPGSVRAKPNGRATRPRSDLERMLADRWVEVDHTTMCRWVQRFAPELEKRMRRHLRPCCGRWHVDENYLRVDGQWR